MVTVTHCGQKGEISMITNLLEKISELEQRIVELKSEVEKEEKENKITNKRWRAEEGNKYWFVNSSGEPDCLHEYNRDIIDDFRYDTHNYLQTEEEALRYAKVLETERQLKKFADEYNGDIYWTDINQENCSLCYNYIRCEVVITRSCTIKDARVIYFSSEEIAKQVIDEIGTDKIKEYLTYEW